MIPNPRQTALIDFVRERGAVSVESAAEHFEVTLQTVRRDMKLLEQAGLLARFHGGARLPAVDHREPGLPPAPRTAGRGQAAHRARCAAAVPNGSSLILNIGTTMEAIAASWGATAACA
jgi:DeoR family glycerol-3-phosphate regulon repressor